MTREERLQFCKLCKNRKTDFQQGMLCSLTGKHADFEGNCKDFYPDSENTISSPRRERNDFKANEGSSTSGMSIISIIILIIAIIRLFAIFLR